MDLTKLAEPFPAEDIKWRVSRSGMGQGGLYCMVIPYITARALQTRLDEVCGPENWRTEPLQVYEVKQGVVAMQVGISIRLQRGLEFEWITKWDVSEPTKDQGDISSPAKGGFSQASKRAGSQWGIARYLRYIPESFAEVSDQKPQGSGWNYAKLPEKHGGAAYYWKAPRLPGWALPKEQGHGIEPGELNDLKRSWRDKYAKDSKNPADLREGFARFVASLCGEFPSADHTCWTREALDKCMKRILETTEPGGLSPDVPFEA